MKRRVTATVPLSPRDDAVSLVLGPIPGFMSVMMCFMKLDHVLSMWLCNLLVSLSPGELLGIIKQEVGHQGAASPVTGREVQRCAECRVPGWEQLCGPGSPQERLGGGEGRLPVCSWGGAVGEAGMPPSRNVPVQFVGKRTC